MSSIIASNIPKSAELKDIKDFFAFGDDKESTDVEEITPLDSNHETKTFRVHFSKPELISNALLLNGSDFQKSTVRVVEEFGGKKSLVAEAY